MIIIVYIHSWHINMQNKVKDLINLFESLILKTLTFKILLYFVYNPPDKYCLEILYSSLKKYQ